MPRHVAYILTMLTERERALVPWYRVVAENGIISAPKTERAKDQIEALINENIQIIGVKSIADFDAIFIAAEDLQYLS
jgi:alkylated DNA nucleotide flippase Atl1